MPKNKNIRNYRNKPVVNLLCPDWIRFLASLIVENKIWFLISSVLILLLTGVTLVQTWVIQNLVDKTTEFNFEEIIHMLIVLLGVVIFNIVFNYYKIIATTQFGANSGAYLKNQISYKIIYCKYQDIRKASTGDVLKTINTDVESVCNFISNDMTNLLSQIVMLIAAIIYLVCNNPLIGIITFLYTPFGMYLTYYINNKMCKLYVEMTSSEGTAVGVFEQVISQISVIKTFNMQKRRLRKVHTEYQLTHDKGMYLSKYNGLLQTACSLVASIPRIIFFCLASYLIVKDKITLGTMIAMIQLLDYIIGPTVYFPFLLDGLNQARASMGRIKKIMDDLKITEHVIKTQEHGSLPPNIKMKDVSFFYDDINVLEKFNFMEEQCGITVLSGSSGKGKTTILDLISGIQYPDKGEVVVTGKIFTITQDTYIFTGNIIDNVRIARPGATDEEVIKALRLACIDSFCSTLVNGYKTMIGDGYVTLSGGQKQRISLARMFLTDADILLLDEPTSALDMDTEYKIIKEIINLSKNKMIIISAHRDALLKIANRRYEL